MTPTPRSVGLLARALVVSLVVSVIVASADAQSISRPTGTTSSRWSTIRIAKWTLLGAAAAFGGYALAHSNRASHSYGALHRLCNTDAPACALANGRYTDPRAESFYQTTVRHDRRAQIAILAGHTALLGSAALFVADLRHPSNPPNIPFPSSSEAVHIDPSRFAVGVSVAF
jgi:hypothetical protein